MGSRQEVLQVRPRHIGLSPSGRQRRLFETLDPLSNCLGLLVIQPSDAFVMRCLTSRLAFGYVLRDLIYLKACSLQRWGLYGGFALPVCPVATCTLFLVKSCPIIRGPRKSKTQRVTSQPN